MDDEDRRLIDSAGHRRYLFVCQELGAPGDAPKKLSTS